jgi:hypothetical protein
MSESYYLKTRPGTDGKYLIHRSDCPFLPQSGNRLFLGKFRTGTQAEKYGICSSHPVRYCPYCFAIQNNMTCDGIYNKKKAAINTNLSGIPDKYELIDVMFCSTS